MATIDNSVEPIKCVSCSSNINENDCMYDNDYEVAECVSAQGHCYTAIINETLRRGCVGDDFVSDSDICDSAACKKCFGDKFCNNLYDVKTEKCFSSIYNKHDRVTPHVVTCEVNLLEKLGCYHMEDPETNIIRRGCAADLTDQKRIECSKNGENCKICYGDRCNNKHTFEQCLTCDSNINSNCIVPDNMTEIKQCSAYNDECYIFANGTTVRRGCVRDMDVNDIIKCAEFDRLCEKCYSNFNGKYCNERPLIDTCLRCDSETDSNCENHPELIDAAVCSLAQSRTGCFLSYNNDTITRGCMEHLNNTDKWNCAQQMDNCQSCFGQNCNVKVNFQQNCYFCSGTNDTHCAELDGETEIIRCENYSSTCLTGMDDKGVTHRRCSSYPVFDEYDFPNGFKLCYGELCNGDVIDGEILK